MSIRKGDQLVLRHGGVEVLVVAVADEQDGLVEVELEGAPVSVPAADLHPAGRARDTDRNPAVPDAPPCPKCGRAGSFLPPARVRTDLGVMHADFRCPAGHQWIKAYPLQ